jgi:BlaR1 peptidase M56
MLTYFLQVNLCWLMFYGLYYALLSRETFFKLNRIYLIISLLCGLVIPFSIPTMAVTTTSPMVEMVQPIVISMVEIRDNIETNFTTPEAATWNLWMVLKGVYIIGMGLLFVKFFIGLNKIFHLYKTGEKEIKTLFKLIKSPKTVSPFSFFNLIFINQKTTEDVDYQQIIEHEKAHVIQKHSFDIVGLEILRGLFWLSPLVHLYARSLRNVHEYLADAAVLQNTEKQQYGRLLISQTTAGSGLSLANHLNFSQLKKRIIMMTRNESQRLMLLKYTLALPLFALLVFAFTLPNNPLMQNTEGVAEKVENAVQTVDNQWFKKNNKKPYVTVKGTDDTLQKSNNVFEKNVNDDKPYVCLAINSKEPKTGGFIKLDLFQATNGILLKNNLNWTYKINQFYVYKVSGGKNSNLILNKQSGVFNEEVEQLIKSAQNGDRFYFHDILVDKKGEPNPINLGTLTFYIGEDKPLDIVRFPIPNPSVKLANTKTMPRDLFANMTQLDLQQPDYKVQIRCDVQSFSMIRKSSDNSDKQTNNIAATFKIETLNMIQQAKVGDVYEFRTIKVRCPGDIAARALDGFSITITE